MIVMVWCEKKHKNYQAAQENEVMYTGINVIPF